jgi:hypothetical protein
MNIILLLLPLFITFDEISSPNVVTVISPDDAIQVAENIRDHIDQNINNYTGLFIKRELVDGKDTGYQYIEFKYRENPHAIYLKFLKPASLQNREVLYNGAGELVVKKGGRSTTSMTLYVGTDSLIALEGNRYGIEDMGLKTLSQKLIERLKEESFLPGTEIKIYNEAKVDGRPVVLYRLIHSQPHSKATSLMAEIAVDKELNLPIYYKAMDKDGNGRWIILEEYTFRNMKFDVNFTDLDFNEENPEYGFKKRN